MVKRLMDNWDGMTVAFRRSVTIFDAVRAWIEKNFVQVMIRFFTSTLPTAFDLWKESVRLVFDVIKTRALDTVLGITVAFGHLPGPLGAPFRAASKDIRGELAKIQGDAANAASNINADWDKLHGKTVTIDVVTSLGGSLASGGSGHRQKTKGFAGGTSGAPPRWWWAGAQGRELVESPHDCAP